MTEANSFTVETDKCLQALNSLALPAKASHFCTLSQFDHVKQALDFATYNDLTVIPLGAGSNVVLASNLTGLVLSLELLALLGKKVIRAIMILLMSLLVLVRIGITLLYIL